jgi:pimeloyl-ACP methyl ester carboxylesterase
MDGKLHIYAPRHALFEYTPHASSQESSKVLLFIAGLGDTFSTVPYVPDLAVALPAWRVCHVQLSSSGKGWGMASLDEDCEEIGIAVNWAREQFKLATGDGKVDIVLIGHSTGCQDVLHYLHTSPSSPRPAVQGAILQAPVSDREAMLNSIAKNPAKKAIYEHCMTFANSLDEDEQKDMIIPIPWSQEIYFDRTPLSVSRFLSLTSPGSPAKPEPDDLFSSDATKAWLEATFGKLGKSEAFAISSSSAHGKPNMLIAMMGADEAVPEHVDTDILLLRWKKAIEKDGTAVLDEASGVVAGGKHNLRGKDGDRKKARDDFVEMVSAYLGRVVGRNEGEVTSLPIRQSL